jgi:hypothetical protein
MASKIEIRQHDPGGTLLGYFYMHLEPEEVRQNLTARGTRALADEAGIYIPEINDAHMLPFHSRPDVVVGNIIRIDNAAYQTILERE